MLHCPQFARQFESGSAEATCMESSFFIQVLRTPTGLQQLTYGMLP